MAECNHVFIGRSDGVYCTKCGLYMTAADYAAFLHPDKTAVKPETQQKEKAKRQTRKRVKNDE